MSSLAVKLKWWFVFVSSVAGLLVAYRLGFLYGLWRADVTKLSFLAILVFFAFSLFVGWMVHSDKVYIRDVQKHLPSCWLAAELLMGLGMMGTILGFLIMLTDVFGGTVTAADVIQKAAPGLATVCVTTFVGLLTSFLLKVHLVNLEYLVDE